MREDHGKEKCRRLRLKDHVARMEEGRSALKILTGKIPLGRHKRRWENHIRIELKKIGINWVDSAQYRDYWRALMNAALNLRIP